MITWTRAELKSRGKAAVKMFYWKLVLVSLILSAITGGVSSAGRNGAKSSLNTSSGSTDISGILGGINPIAWAVALTAALVVLVIAFAIRVFALNVLAVGCKGFFSESMRKEPEFGTVVKGFTGNYWNCVKTCFLRDLFVGLWSLLFIIPGVIKSYEYRMVPYLLAEHPEMSSSEVFAQSKEMMNGNKLDTFVLDLSFIGWAILSAITMGIVFIFWTSPYINATEAALYHRLSGQDSYGNGGYGQAGYARNGYDQANYTQNGYSQSSYDQTNYNPNGYSQGGSDQTNYNPNGYNQENYDQSSYGKPDDSRNGQNPSGGSSNSGYDQNYFSDK